MKRSNIFSQLSEIHDNRAIFVVVAIVVVAFMLDNHLIESIRTIRPVNPYLALAS